MNRCSIRPRANMATSHELTCWHQAYVSLPCSLWRRFVLLCTLNYKLVPTRVTTIRQISSRVRHQKKRKNTSDFVERPSKARVNKFGTALFGGRRPTPHDKTPGATVRAFPNVVQSNIVTALPIKRAEETSGMARPGGGNARLDKHRPNTEAGPPLSRRWRGENDRTTLR